MRGSAGPGHGRLAVERPCVWLLDVTAPGFLDLAERGLASREEQERAASLRDSAAGRRLIARRTALRLVLGRYLERDPSDVRIVTAPGGKPVLVPDSRDASPGKGAGGTGSRPPRSLAFSVAHSGDLYGIAVGRVGSLGLDVERLRDVSRATAIAQRWFGQAEARHLAGLGAEELQHEFMRLWTGKEALAKCHGAGLRLMTGGEIELDVDTAVRSGRLRPFPPADGYVGAVASTEIIGDIEVVRPDSEAWIT
jgi:4'-phosphopantetheinyl transferase